MSDYEYYNHNPEGERISDCVSRAIGTATGLSYKTVNRLLSKTAENFECDKLCVCCYKHLLSQLFGYEKYNCKPGVLVKDVLKDFNDCTLIIRIAGHLTCAKNGVILDTWNCSDYEVDCFWIVS
jgi:hypothetical protein